MEYKKQRIFDSSVYMNLYKSRPKSKVVGKSGYDGSTCTSWYQLKHNKSANFFDTKNTISENKEHKRYLNWFKENEKFSYYAMFHILLFN